MSKELHGAMIKINLDVLLEMLDFKGGRIHKIYTDDECFDPDYFNVLIEHPDLPVVSAAEKAPPITPLYTKYFGDNGGLIKIERSDPPKSTPSSEG